MRNLRVIRRGDDMPLYGKVTRVGKGKYQVVIKAKASKRIVDIEQLPLPSIAAVKQFYARTYPTLTWGEPKYPKPRLKIVRTKKKVTRKSKPRKRATTKRKKTNAVSHPV
jgi:hypothetical protein